MGKLFSLILLLFVISVIVIATVLLPGLFGYVGTDRYEWAMLRIAIIAVPTAIVLGLILVILMFEHRR